MNDKKNNLAMGIKFLLYGIVVVLALIGWFGDKTGLTLGVGYALIGLSIALVLIFSIMALVEAPKKSIRSLLGFAAIIIIFFIAFSAASDVNLSKEVVSANYVKFVGGSLTLLYIVGGIALLSIVVSEVYSFFK